MSILPTPDSVPEEAITKASGDVDGFEKAVVGGVIAAVFITLITVVVLITVYLYKHKGSYRTNENLEDVEASKTLQMEDSALTPEKKEYFM
ncbi:small cell adhesion glycoprotein homolog [Xenopus tropicalis]|uniref:Small cell adhesion glycoprotein homolog n=1 Tax=Xenopus tropicalis TaxID=8364 RepID=B0JZR0_XENTR|nr:small cell adhesion glycoprotein homolog [Xenopus tropicalis]AAI59287.1 Unknown (protein for MGC:180535) [Xenopus tropicalis]|eukprot:NP_001039035.2 small cell adhesion glycoprotein homolog [Xenopus tropicalis]